MVYSRWYLKNLNSYNFYLILKMILKNYLKKLWFDTEFYRI